VAATRSSAALARRHRNNAINHRGNIAKGSRQAASSKTAALLRHSRPHKLIPLDAAFSSIEGSVKRRYAHHREMAPRRRGMPAMLPHLNARREAAANHQSSRLRLLRAMLREAELNMHGRRRPRRAAAEAVGRNSAGTVDPSWAATTAAAVAIERAVEAARESGISSIITR